MSFEYRIIQIRLHRLVKFFYVLIVVLHTFSHLCIANGAAEQDHNSNGAFELISEASQTPDIILNLEEAVSSDENNSKQNLTEFVELVSPSLLRESDHDLRILDPSVIDDSDVVSSKQTSENIQLPDTPAISDMKDGEIDEIDIETKLIVEQQDLFEESIGPSVVGDFDIGNHLDNPFLDDLESASSSNYDHVTFDDTSADVPTSYEEAEGEDRTNTHDMTADPDSHANQSAMTVPGEIQSKIEIETILDENNPIDDANSQDNGAILIDITGSSSTSASSELDVPEGTVDRTRPDINDTKDDNDSDNDGEINVGSEGSSGTSGNSGSDSSSGSSSSGSSSGSGSSGSGSSSGGSSSSSSGSGSSTDTVLSRSLDSRIRRLAALVADRRDLIDSYNTQQMEEETIMNSLNRHIMAALQHRPLVPLSDSTCTWSYLRERYRMNIQCSFRVVYLHLYIHCVSKTHCPCISLYREIKNVVRTCCIAHISLIYV
jgi:hypothetical protein